MSFCLVYDSILLVFSVATTFSLTVKSSFNVRSYSTEQPESNKITNKDYYKYVTKFVENTKRQNLSTAALEVLSIIAYNPKITKSEIESIRGVNSDFAVSRLLECGLVEEVARLNLPGRPAAYSVTNEFLKSCGIGNIEELPKFDEIKIKDEQLLVSDFDESKEEN